MKPRIDLSILIVNFNGKQFLAECIQSIHENIGVPFEIIVVDNASQDGSVDFIRQTFPDVQLVAHHSNAGFAGGNNIAAAHAQGRFLLLLNNDTRICRPLDPMMSMMVSHPDIGAMGCRLVYADARLQESVGHIPTPWSLALSWTPLVRLWPKVRRTLLTDSSVYVQPSATVDWVSGACLLTPADLWQQLGGLDEAYFMYMEDTDYCRRVGESGYKVVYTNLSEVLHYEGAGRAWIGERAVLNTTDSYLVYARKFHGVLGQWLLRALLFPVFLLRSVGNWLAAETGADLHGRDKARAFSKAASRLLGLKGGIKCQ